MGCEMKPTRLLSDSLRGMLYRLGETKGNINYAWSKYSNNAFFGGVSEVLWRHSGNIASQIADNLREEVCGANKKTINNK